MYIKVDHRPKVFFKINLNISILSTTSLIVITSGISTFSKDIGKKKETKPKPL